MSTPAVPIRVLIADDSSMVRGLLRSILETQADIQVVGEATNGRQAQEIFKKFNRASRSIPVTLPVDKLARLHPSMRRQVLRLAIEETKGNTRQISFQHILAIEALVAEGAPAQTRLQLPGLTVQKKNGQILFRC